MQKMTSVQKIGPLYFCIYNSSLVKYPNNMKFKIALLIISIFSLSSFLYFSEELNDEEFSSDENSSTLSPTSALMLLLKKDFDHLKKSNSLSKNLYDVRQIQFYNKSESLNLVQSELKSFIRIKKSGQFIMTVDFFSFPQEDNSYLVQLNWINAKTKDKVWEINRVYRLSKKKPDHF